MALVEGMYYGKPPMTFAIRRSGINCVNLDGMPCIECSIRDINAYAKALDKLANDAELRKKNEKATQKKVLDNFTFKRFQEDMTGVLRNL